MMQKAVALLLLLTMLAGCSLKAKGPKPPATPPVGTPAVQDEGREERFVRETLAALAEGRHVDIYPELGAGPGFREGDLPHFALPHLRAAAQAWEAAGLAAPGSKPLALDRYSGPDPREVAKRFPFFDLKQAEILYLDRSGAPERYGALIRANPLGAFLYMAFRPEGERLVLNRLVDTRVAALRRSPEFDLQVLSELRAGRGGEHLLAPAQYLVLEDPNTGGSEPLGALLNRQELPIRALEGQLLVGERMLNLDWVLLPGGQYKVAGATLHANWNPQDRSPVQPVLAQPLTPARGLTAAQVKAAAEQFLRHWSREEYREAEAMAGDLGRFYALSGLSRGGGYNHSYSQSFWTLGGEKARLEHGFTLPFPVPFAQAKVADVVMDVLPRARVAFPGTPVTVELIVPEPGRVASVSFLLADIDSWTYRRQDDRALLEHLMRMGDWAQGASILEALAAGRSAEAAKAAGLTPPELEAQLKQAGWQSPATAPHPGARAEPASYPHTWQLVQDGGVVLALGEQVAAMSFTGLDGARRMTAISFGTRERPPSVPRGLPTAKPAGPAALDHYGGLSAAGANVLHVNYPDYGPIQARPLLLYRGEGGKLIRAAELPPPAPGTAWHEWRHWQHPGRAEWWVAYGTEGYEPRLQGLAQINWPDGQPPRVVALHPAPADSLWWESRFADLDGDGVPELATLVGQPDGQERQQLSIRWLRSGAWQERRYPAGLDNPWPVHDAAGGRLVWAMPDGLRAVTMNSQSGPGEAVTFAFPFGDQARNDAIKSAGGLIWWSQDARVHWLAPDGIRSAPGKGVAAFGDLQGRGGSPLLLISQAEPQSALALFTLEGKELWTQPWPWAMENGTLLRSGKGVTVAAHGRSPYDPRVSRVMGLTVGAGGPALLWQGPPTLHNWHVGLAPVDADGTAQQDLIVAAQGSRGQTAFYIFSDTATEWGPPIIKP